MQEAVIALLVQAVGDWVIEAINPHPGSVWITAVDGRFGSWNGKVVSAYYHPTRPHTATTVGKLGTKQSQADPGQWAISTQTKGLYGNKAYQNTL